MPVLSEHSIQEHIGQYENAADYEAASCYNSASSHAHT